jgi:hypothetical protein
MTAKHVGSFSSISSIEHNSGVDYAREEVCIKRIGSAVLLFPKDAAWDLMGEARLFIRRLHRDRCGLGIGKRFH